MATATARAQEVAEELGVDLAQLGEGTGKDGRITVEDIRAAAAAAATGIPADFDDDQVATWEEVVEYLEGFDLWNPLHAPLLERYIRRLARAADARERAEAEPIVEGSTGKMKASPFFRIEADADGDAHKYAEALMLTPEMLHKHLKGGEGEDDGDLGF